MQVQTHTFLQVPQWRAHEVVYQYLYYTFYCYLLLLPDLRYYPTMSFSFPETISHRFSSDGENGITLAHVINSQISSKLQCEVYQRNPNWVWILRSWTDNIYWYLNVWCPSISFLLRPPPFPVCEVKSRVNVCGWRAAAHPDWPLPKKGRLRDTKNPSPDCLLGVHPGHIDNNPLPAMRTYFSSAIFRMYSAPKSFSVFLQG